MEFDSPGMPAISAAAGVEFILFDMEHTGWALEKIKQLAGACIDQKIVPIVRVPTTEYHWIAHALDVGAMGIVIPLCKSVDQAKFAVECAKYPPAGRRGCAFGVAHDRYSQGDVREKITHTNENVMVIAQIENPEGLENCEAIAAVEGIDGLWVGQFDLSATMGIPADFENPKIKQAIKRVVKACHDHGKFATLGASNPIELINGPANGFRMLIYVADLWIYQKALRECMDAIANSSS